jgi:carbamoyl-phosphate synthase small subunit
MKGKAALLVLADGTVFQGKSTGLDGTAWGEICFNTGMTGYQEIFTDPSYLGQLMVTATSHIGNYGIHPEEGESNRVQIAGLVCKSFSLNQTRPGATQTLEEYFRAQGKVAISDVDTRAVVRHIRQAGAMNAIVSTETEDVAALLDQLSKVPSMDGLELLPQVSTGEVRHVQAENEKFRVAALDFGIKENILRRLNAVGISVDLYPYTTPFGVLAESHPDGYFLSNGPGDPSASPQVVETVKQLIDSGKPIFGICLGHQMIALATGLRTFKMHNGHRGINHPVKNVLTGKGEITSQNHGFAVSMEDVDASPLVELTHVHLNDGTVAGLRRTDKPVFSVQYHPEAAPGPHDSRYLFEQFVELMNTHKS